MLKLNHGQALEQNSQLIAQMIRDASDNAGCDLVCAEDHIDATEFGLSVIGFVTDVVFDEIVTDAPHAAWGAFVETGTTPLPRRSLPLAA